MSERPLVSVLMLNYNHERFINEAIQGIVSQSYTHWEMIVVDDASSDGSWEIIQQWARRDPRIESIRMAQKTSITNVLNSGLQHANGEYIARADSDDIWLPLRLETQ